MPGHDDIVLDGLALVSASHARDAEGGLAVLANCDAVAVCGFLAMLAADLIEQWIEPGDAGEALARLREHYST